MFKPTTDWELTNLTSLQGYLTVSYEKLVRLFGEPQIWEGDDKTRFEWTLTDGVNGVTIYDWKDSNPESIPSRPSFEWNVGAHRKETAEELVRYVNSLS